MSQVGRRAQEKKRSREKRSREGGRGGKREKERERERERSSLLLQPLLSFPLSLRKEGGFKIPQLTKSPSSY
jgi:hypothetical protein